jgi:hypothetical protein
VEAVDFGGSGSVSTCTTAQGIGTYYNPRIAGGFAVTPHAGNAAVAPFVLTVQSLLGDPRVYSAKPVLDVLDGKMLWPSGMLPKNAP